MAWPLAPNLQPPAGTSLAVLADMNQTKQLSDREQKPEEPAPPKPKPEMGKQPDLSNPDPEMQIPGKPISDMDPPGQDEPEESS